MARTEWKCRNLKVKSRKVLGERFFYAVYPDGIAALPYLSSPEGRRVILRVEPIPGWGDGDHVTAVMGTGSTGKTPIETLVNEMQEEAGIDLLQNGEDDMYRRLTPCGSYREGKRSVKTLHLFLTDVTGLDMSTPKGDGSALEAAGGVVLVSPEQAEEDAEDLALRYLLLRLCEVT